jgi:hypothetical protein
MKAMKLVIAAALAIGAAGAAQADRTVVHHKTVVVKHTQHHGGRAHNRRQVCNTKWVNHHKVRRCHWQSW